ncbi:MAG: hypothetical protein ABH868_04645 [bacterium]
MIKRAVFLVLTTVFLIPGFNSFVFAQMPTELIEIPTAEIISYGNFDLNFRMYGKGDFLTRLSFGALRSVDLGFHLDLGSITGNDEIEMREPSLRLKIKLYGGNFYFPALAIGYDAQGHGNYIQKGGLLADGTVAEEDTYTEKARGIFAVATKEIFFEGLYVHGGGNVSDLDHIKIPDNLYGFLGVSRQLGDQAILMVEYDNIKKFEDEENNRFNIGLSYLMTTQLSLDFAWKNIKKHHIPERILRINYVEAF